MAQYDNKLDLNNHDRSNNCFIAGTLVHTLNKNSNPTLTPIQELKVGDVVLSRNEYDVNAPNVYKKVLRTKKSAEYEPIIAIPVKSIDEEDVADVNEAEYLFCTANHRFWVSDEQETLPQTQTDKWVPAIDLAMDTYFLSNVGYKEYVVYTAHGQDMIDEPNSRDLFSRPYPKLAVVPSLGGGGRPFILLITKF